MSNNEKAYKVLTQTYLGPTNGLRTYGEVALSIVEADDYGLKYDGICYNNIFQNYSEEEYATEAEAQKALENSDDYQEYPKMNKSNTEDHLYETVKNSITMKSTDEEISILVHQWATDKSDIIDNESVIDTEVAIKMCEERRKECIQEADDE
jgi:hypothetical protein